MNAQLRRDRFLALASVKGLDPEVIGDLLDKAVWNVQQAQGDPSSPFVRQYLGKAEGIITALAAVLDVAHQSVHDHVASFVN